MRGRAVKGLALLLGIAALVCGWLLYRSIPAGDPSATESAVTEPPAYFMLYTRALPAFVRMTLETPDSAPYALLSNLVYDEAGALASIAGDLLQPVSLAGDAGFRLSETACNMALLVAQNLPVTARVEESADNLSRYGLDKPRLRIHIQYQSEEISLEIGARVATGEADYLRVAGEPSVYLVPADLSDTFGAGVNELHAVPGALGVVKENILQIQIERAGHETVGVAYKTDAERQRTAFARKLYLPFEHDVNADRVDALLLAVSALAPVGYAGREDGTDAFGLASPQARILIALADGSVLEYRIGDDAPEGMAYIAIDRSGDVYKIEKAKLAFLETATALHLADDFVYLPTVTAVREVMIETPRGSHSLRVFWSDDVIPGSAQAAADAYQIDGAPASKDDFTALYAAVIGLRQDKRAPEGEFPPGEALLRVTYSLRTGTDDVTIEFLPYDAHYCAIRVSGQAHFLIRREKIEALALLFDG